MLRACRRVLRPGRRLAFTTIELAEGLQGVRRRRAIAAGARASVTRKPYDHLLRSARFVEVMSQDLTDDFLHTARAWLSGVERSFDAVAAHDGEEATSERVANWREEIEALEEGLLRRTLYAAVRP